MHQPKHEHTLTTDLGLSLIEKRYSSQPFCLYGRPRHLKASIEECCLWALGLVLPGGQLLILTDLNLNLKQPTRVCHLPSSKTSSGTEIHATVARSKSQDVVLLLSERDRERKTGELSDFAELLRAVNGLDLPAEFGNENE